MTREVMEVQIAQIAADTALIKKLLQGNGDPSKGLIVRVDRLEQDAKRRRWIAHSTFAGIGALLALAAEVLGKYFK